MRVVEQPFLTRQAILSVFRPGEITSERPFRTLRGHGAASAGLSIRLRTEGGQVFGRLHVYSTLNADAARAFRLNQREIAQEFGDRAGMVEASAPALRVREAIQAVAAAVPIGKEACASWPQLERYVYARRRTSWLAFDWHALMRQWLTHPDAWFETSESKEELVSAVLELAQLAAEARNELSDTSFKCAVDAFYGIVRRLDPVAAEVEAHTGETVLTPRDDLEREGLAVLGQPVALLREALPGGGTYVLPLVAVALERPSLPDRGSPLDDEAPDGGFLAFNLSRSDAAWFSRELAREPTAVPIAPVPGPQS